MERKVLNFRDAVRIEVEQALRELGILPDVQKIPMPKQGETFTVGGVEFVALGVEQGGLLAITSKAIAELPFDEDNRNDWRESSLRDYLNNEWLLSFPAKDKLLRFVSDLTADDGMTDYGTSSDFVFLLSADLYRKYRKFIPSQDDWWWTLTPWTCNPSHANFVRHVYPSGALSNRYAVSARGVVAGLLFNLSSFEPAGSECDSRAEAEVDA